MKSKLPLGRLAVELVVVIAGVLIALGVDQWAERREHRQLADQVLQGLGAELTANAKQLERRIAYHERIHPGLDSLATLAEGGRRLRLLHSDVLPEGMGLWLLRDTAWETALVTEAVRYIDLPTTTVLSTTYSLQDALGAMEDAIEGGILRPEVLGADDQGGAVIFLAAEIQDLIVRERELASFTRAAIERIRERLGEGVSLESPVQVSIARSRVPARAGADAPPRGVAPPGAPGRGWIRAHPAGG